MTKNNLIEGVNPLYITQFTWEPFYRTGWHPSVYRVLNNTSRWIDRHWLMKHIHKKRGSYSYIHRPRVYIHGDGGILASITCKGNAHAERLHADLERQLSDFISEYALARFNK